MSAKGVITCDCGGFSETSSTACRPQQSVRHDRVCHFARPFATENRRSSLKTKHAHNNNNNNNNATFAVTLQFQIKSSVATVALVPKLIRWSAFAKYSAPRRCKTRVSSVISCGPTPTPRYVSMCHRAGFYKAKVIFFSPSSSQTTISIRSMDGAIPCAACPTRLGTTLLLNF